MKFLLYIWQLPQNIIGLIIKLINKNKKGYEEFFYNGVKVYYVKHIMNCGISLGDYIFLDNDVYLNEKDIMHEAGHKKQSKILGWFYLLIIGLPSVIGNIIDRIFDKGYEWYYSQPWEKWADKLGGVDRNYI